MVDIVFFAIDDGPNKLVTSGSILISLRSWVGTRRGGVGHTVESEEADTPHKYTDLSRSSGPASLCTRLDIWTSRSRLGKRKTRYYCVSYNRSRLLIQGTPLDDFQQYMIYVHLASTRRPFFAHWHASLGRPVGFPLVSCYEARKSHARTLRLMSGLRLRSVARALGFQSGASKLFFKGWCNPACRRRPGIIETFIRTVLVWSHGRLPQQNVAHGTMAHTCRNMPHETMAYTCSCTYS